MSKKLDTLLHIISQIFLAHKKSIIDGLREEGVHLDDFITEEVEQIADNIDAQVNNWVGVHFDYDVSKKDIIDMIKEDYLSRNEKIQIDTAIPLDWANKARELNIDVSNYAWIYDKNYRAFGRPINLLEEFVKLRKE